jgi:hypothetical protein
MKFLASSAELVSSTVDASTERHALELAAACAGLRGERARELALGLRQDPSHPHPVDEAQLREALALRKRRRSSASKVTSGASTASATVSPSASPPPA